MAQNALTYQLTRTELFSGLTPFQITEIARNSERVMYRPGEMISVCGAVSDRAVLVVEGEVECTDGAGAGEPFVGDQAGLIIGEMAMFIDGFEHPSTFAARSATKALMIGRAAMLAQMGHDPEMAEHLVTKVSQRLSNLVQQLRQIENDLDQYCQSDNTGGAGDPAATLIRGTIPSAPMMH